VKNVYAWLLKKCKMKVAEVTKTQGFDVRVYTKKKTLYSL